MIRKTLVIMTVVASITNSAESSPHGHHDPIVELLKELRKARKYSGSGSPIRDESFLGSASNGQVPQFQFPSGSNNGGGSGGSQPPTPILTPNNNRAGSSISGLIPSGGSSSSNFPQNFPQNLPQIPSGSQIAGQLGQLRPYPIEQVNNGVRTILNGVGTFDLGQILRGAFIFPRNENVRNVANNVLDTIFGAAKPTGSN